MNAGNEGGSRARGGAGVGEGIEALASALDAATMVDLAHVLEPNIPSWPGDARYGHDVMESYTLGDVSCHYQLVLGEHTGNLGHLPAFSYLVAQPLPIRGGSGSPVRPIAFIPGGGRAR